jgi:hypothetical protein
MAHPAANLVATRVGWDPNQGYVTVEENDDDDDVTSYLFVYNKKSPLDSHNEHAVKACTTLWPDG